MNKIVTGRQPGEKGVLTIPKSTWRTPDRKTFRYKVYLLEENEGGYSVRAASLPGVVSQGETEEEALDNIVDAFEGVIASYKAHGEEIPWSATEQTMERGEFERWVTIHG